MSVEYCEKRFFQSVERIEAVILADIDVTKRILPTKYQAGVRRNSSMSKKSGLFPD